MSKKQKPARNTIVVGGKGVVVAPSGKRVFQNPAKRKLAILAGVLLLLVVVLVGVLHFRHHKPAGDKTTILPAASEASIKADLNKALSDSKTSTDKSSALVALSSNAVDDNPAAAYDYAQQAVTADGSIKSYAALGLAAKEKGDKAAAIAAYEKAAEIGQKSSDPDEQQAAKYFAQVAAELKK
jgi:hypothetical protein